MGCHASAYHPVSRGSSRCRCGPASALSPSLRRSQLRRSAKSTELTGQALQNKESGSTAEVEAEAEAEEEEEEEEEEEAEGEDEDEDEGGR